MLYVRTVEGKGRGVFAQRLIRQGEVLEQSPVIVISAKEWESVERTILFNYCYGWGEDMALALGMGSLVGALAAKAAMQQHGITGTIEYGDNAHCIESGINNFKCIIEYPSNRVIRNYRSCSVFHPIIIR